MLMGAPLPSEAIEEMRVTLLPQFLGALARAHVPLGTIAYRGVSATLVEDSSTEIRRSLTALLFSSSRSEAPSVFV
jgi:hypothetical protein